MSCRLSCDDIASREAGSALMRAEASGASLSISLAEAEASFAASSRAWVWPRLNLNAINDAVVPPSNNESGTSLGSHFRTYSSSNASLDALGASCANAATIRGACPSKEANNDVAKSEPPQAKGTNCGASMAAQLNLSEASAFMIEEACSVCKKACNTPSGSLPSSPFFDAHSVKATPNSRGPASTRNKIAFEAASMAEDVRAPCVAAASKHAAAAWRACTSPSSSKTFDRTGKRRLANFFDLDDARAVDKQAAPKATIGAYIRETACASPPSEIASRQSCTTETMVLSARSSASAVSAAQCAANPTFCVSVLMSRAQRQRCANESCEAVAAALKAIFAAGATWQCGARARSRASPAQLVASPVCTRASRIIRPSCDAQHGASVRMKAFTRPSCFLRCSASSVARSKSKAFSSNNLAPRFVSRGASCGCAAFSRSSAALALANKDGASAFCKRRNLALAPACLASPKRGRSAITALCSRCRVPLTAVVAELLVRRCSVAALIDSFEKSR
mmetsp:Transcript_15136/g.43062  ORF Transcript_15136/g.43062 Transcript_15136/m.43062 type:complete len:509 (-) Transcript_15136:56-1582(-)